MRMWNLDPRTMCRKHLMGEHLEMHMFVGSINRGISMTGYIEHGLLDIASLADRHEDLVTEIERRGYKHKSPLPDFESFLWPSRPIDVEWSKAELARRCPECKRLQDAFV